MLTHLSLFSGIGGLDLAAEWAGFTTVGQCEWADYPTKVLEKHWPDVPRWRDICELSAREFIHRTGIQPGELTVISGGFPCQPFSVAGNQKGKEDDRYLWPEMLRVISEIHPSYIIGENVPGILNIAADDVCKDLEREGYEVGIFDYEAAAVGATHRRERFFFVGYSKHDGLSSTEVNRVINQAGNHNTERQNQASQFKRADKSGNYENVAYAYNKGLESTGFKLRECQTITENGIEYSSSNVSNTNEKRLQRSKKAGNTCKSGENRNKFITGLHNGTGWWSVEPNVGRVANGVPNRVDRLKCLGNAVVPYQAYPIFKAIADIELHDTPSQLR